MLAFAGVTAMETRTTGVTVRFVEPMTPPSDAVICVVPGPTPVARPPLPKAVVIDATAGFTACQETTAVRFCVVLSE
jgi:hypothetical protein